MNRNDPRAHGRPQLHMLQPPVTQVRQIAFFVGMNIIFSENNSTESTTTPFTPSASCPTNKCYPTELSAQTGLFRIFRFYEVFKTRKLRGLFSMMVLLTTILICQMKLIPMKVKLIRIRRQILQIDKKMKNP